MTRMAGRLRNSGMTDWGRHLIQIERGVISTACFELFSANGNKPVVALSPMSFVVTAAYEYRYPRTPTTRESNPDLQREGRKEREERGGGEIARLGGGGRDHGVNQHVRDIAENAKTLVLRCRARCNIKHRWVGAASIWPDVPDLIVRGLTTGCAAAKKVVDDLSLLGVLLVHAGDSFLRSTTRLHPNQLLLTAVSVVEVKLTTTHVRALRGDSNSSLSP